LISFLEGSFLLPLFKGVKRQSAVCFFVLTFCFLGGAFGKTQGQNVQKSVPLREEKSFISTHPKKKTVEPLTHKEPLTIRAKKLIQCDEVKRQCKAEGDVYIAQKGIEVRADTATLDFKKTGPKAQRELIFLKAKGHVRVRMPDLKATGELLTYQAMEKVLRFKGRQRLEFDRFFVLTDQPLTFYEENRCIRGVAIHVGSLKPEAALWAEKMTLELFEKNPVKKGVEGLPAIKSASIEGAVLFATKTQTVRSQQGFYCGDSDLLTLKGAVRGVVEQNVVEGERGYYNFKKRSFKMQGCAKSAHITPVSGIFYAKKG